MKTEAFILISVVAPGLLLAGAVIAFIKQRLTKNRRYDSILTRAFFSHMVDWS